MLTDAFITGHRVHGAQEPIIDAVWVMFTFWSPSPLLFSCQEHRDQSIKASSSTMGGSCLALSIKVAFAVRVTAIIDSGNSMGEERREKDCKNQWEWKAPRKQGLLDTTELMQIWTHRDRGSTHRSRTDGVPALGGDVNIAPYPYPRSYL